MIIFTEVYDDDFQLSLLPFYFFVVVFYIFVCLLLYFGLNLEVYCQATFSLILFFNNTQRLSMHAKVIL